MELFIFNSKIELQGVIDNFGTLIWTRRFRKPGSFQLNLPATKENISLMQEENLIYRKGYKEAGVISYIHSSLSESGVRTLEIKGYFTTAYLNRRINWGTINYSGHVETFMRKVINDNCINPVDIKRKIPHLELGELKNYPEAIHKQDSYSNVSELCEKLCEASKLGYRIALDVKNKKLEFEVLKGVDRTVGNGSIAPTIFSTDMENVITEEYIYDTGDYCNVTLIAGAGEGTSRKTTSIGNAEGLNRFELYTDARDIEDTKQVTVIGDDGNETTKDVEMDWHEYEPLLYQRGQEKLEEHKKIETFESTINANGNNKYRKNYDLGDKVTIYSKELGKRVDTDITEIEETYEKQKVTIKPNFGNNIPTLFEMLRKE